MCGTSAGYYKNALDSMRDELNAKKSLNPRVRMKKRDEIPADCVVQEDYYHQKKPEYELFDIPNP